MVRPAGRAFADHASGKPMNLLVVCPLPQEYRAVKRALGLEPVQSRSGRKRADRGRVPIRVSSVLSGPGPKRAAAATSAALETDAFDLVVDFGTCAALAPDLSIGDIVLATECAAFTASGRDGPFSRGRPCGLRAHPSLAADGTVKIGRQASGRIVVAGRKTRRGVREATEADAVNWETAAVFGRALSRGVPAVSLRIVTDLGDRHALRDFRRQVRAQSARLADFLSTLIESGWFERAPFACWVREWYNGRPKTT